MNAYGPEDRLAMRSRAGYQPEVLARDIEFHQADRAQGLQRRIQGQGELRPREGFVQRAAQEQRQVGHEQVRPHPHLRLVIDRPHLHDPLEFAEGPLHHQQFLVGSNGLADV